MYSLPCSKGCGAMVTRHNKIDNPVCFNCRRDRNRASARASSKKSRLMKDMNNPEVTDL